MYRLIRNQPHFVDSIRTRPRGVQDLLRNDYYGHSRLSLFRRLLPYLCIDDNPFRPLSLCQSNGLPFAEATSSSCYLAAAVLIMLSTKIDGISERLASSTLARLVRSFARAGYCYSFHVLYLVLRLRTHTHIHTQASTCACVHVRVVWVDAPCWHRPVHLLSRASRTQHKPVYSARAVIKNVDSVRVNFFFSWISRINWSW